jgi:dihydrofolate synthase/folylpolyglutamate synthase
MMRNNFNSCNVDNVQIGFPNFAATMIAARNNALKGDLILVFGSFFLVSEFLAEIEKGK